MLRYFIEAWSFCNHVLTHLDPYILKPGKNGCHFHHIYLIAFSYIESFEIWIQVHQNMTVRKLHKIPTLPRFMPLLLQAILHPKLCWPWSVAPYAVRQQAITCANVDPNLSHHMAPLGHSESIYDLSIHLSSLIKIPFTIIRHQFRCCLSAKVLHQSIKRRNERIFVKCMSVNMNISQQGIYLLGLTKHSSLQPGFFHPAMKINTNELCYKLNINGFILYFGYAISTLERTWSGPIQLICARCLLYIHVCLYIYIHIHLNTSTTRFSTTVCIN